MRHKQGQSHAKTHKLERELKKKNGGARAGCACVKAGLEPGPLLYTNQIKYTRLSRKVVAIETATLIYHWMAALLPRNDDSLDFHSVSAFLLV